MYISKPRPRLDGVYVSLNSYIRSGQTEGQYDQPVFKIRYYRYLRFFSDGGIIIVCTPKPPKIVIPQLKYGSTCISGGKEPLDVGSFEILDENIISQSKIYLESVKTNRPQGELETKYCYSFRLSSSYHGWHDRLIVEDYFTVKDQVRCSFENGFVKTFKFVHVPSHIFDSGQDN